MKLPDIHPQSPITALDREAFQQVLTFSVDDVAPAVGMSRAFIKKVIGTSTVLSSDDVLRLLDQDAYSETFIRRSQVLNYLTNLTATAAPNTEPTVESWALHLGNATEILNRIEHGSVQCVVTSTPYWGLRVYEDSTVVTWLDGEVCAYGHEQTPEGFIRHTTQILHQIKPLLTDNASVWWNLMDSYNTRTQIRGSAREALTAMQGKDDRAWADHEARRYSAGHAFLKDGEQCMIPTRVAQRASLIGYYVKSVITWAKQSSLPEPQNSRVSRNLEYVLHLTTTRTPKFDKTAYRRLDQSIGGRNAGYEPDKLSDVWVLPTSPGRDGHGAQFPTALPGRCIALTTGIDDVVLDPFVGSGNSGVAARRLGRKFIGIDVSSTYLTTAEEKITNVKATGFEPRAATISLSDPATPVPIVDAG